MKQPGCCCCVCCDGGGATELKCAWQVAFVVRLKLTVVEKPLQSPLQPPKEELLPGEAVNVTVPCGNSAWQAVPQRMRESLDLTSPMPFPVRSTVTTRKPPISRTPG